MLQTIVNITGINAIAQSILLALFFLANKKGIRISNRLLAALLLVFGVLIFSTLPGASYRFSGYYKWAFVLRRFAFLIAPLFYFYIQSCVDSKFRLRWKDCLHFIPFAVLFGLTLFQAFYLHIWLITFAQEYLVHTSAILVHNAIYLAVTMRYLKKRRISLKALFLETDNVQGQWLRFFILGYSVFWLINFHNLFLMNFLGISTWCPYASSIYSLIPFLFFNIIAFIALLKPEVFSSKNRNGETVLDESISRRYRNKLNTAMEIQKPYLNPDLSMGDLARALAIPVKHLSYLINNTLHINFYDFINQYRIEESKQLLAESGEDEKNILDIAYDVGFNSKSTFNSAFKKQTGMTPSEYRKSTLFRQAAVSSN